MSLEFTSLWSKLVVASWSDETLRNRMRQDPISILKERGAKIPSGMKLVAHENDNSTVHLVLPTKPPQEIMDLEHTDPAAFTYYIF